MCCRSDCALSDPAVVLCCAVLCLWTAGTADRIVQEGFDMRLVNHSSAYGNGVYFAGE